MANGWRGTWNHKKRKKRGQQWLPCKTVCCHSLSKRSHHVWTILTIPWHSLQRVCIAFLWLFEVFHATGTSNKFGEEEQMDYGLLFLSALQEWFLWSRVSLNTVSHFFRLLLAEDAKKERFTVKITISLPVV